MMPRALAFVFAVTVAGCAGSSAPAGPPAGPPNPIVYADAVSAETYAALDAVVNFGGRLAGGDPGWNAGEELLGFCDAGDDRTVVVTTRRYVRVGFYSVHFPVQSARIRGYEEVELYVGRGGRPTSIQISGRTATGGNRSFLAYGRCDGPGLVALLQRAVALNAEQGEALLAEAEEEAARPPSSGSSAPDPDDLNSPPLPGVTWASIGATSTENEAYRRLFEHFDLTPSDIVRADRVTPDEDPGFGCSGSGIGQLCTAQIDAEYGGPCRAAALVAALGYYQAGGEGKARTECRNHNVDVGFGFGDISVQQFRRGSSRPFYTRRGPFSLLD